MLFNCKNYDDEQIKLDVMESHINAIMLDINVYENMQMIFDTDNTAIDILTEQLGEVSYKLVMYLIEIHYAEYYPFLANRLRYWIDEAIRTQRDYDEGGLVVEALKYAIPAQEMEALLDELDRY